MTQKNPKRIFISYRWSYAYNEAKILQRSIESNFENVLVFRDEERADPGESLTETILNALDETDLVLALLHESWKKEPQISEDDTRNKLFLKNDWVRMELNHSKNKKGKKVVPILCGKAKLPPKDNPGAISHVLPECLHFLTSDTLGIELDQSNDSEEGILQFLEDKLTLTRRKKDKKLPPPNRLKEEGLELPDIMPEHELVPEPFLGLPNYEEKHARMFFGRSNEICELWDRLERKPQQLLLLYGYSGVGKSSLLNAGFLPRVKQKGWTVIIERRQSDKELQDLLKEMLERMVAPKTLLVIDQLEEAIIEPFGEEDELPPFFQTLKKSLEENTGLKILLGFRKEYLPEVQKQIYATGLNYQPEDDYFLEPLAKENILEAIKLDQYVRDHFEFEYEDGLETTIADTIEGQDPKMYKTVVSSKAPWLQMLLFNLWQKAIENQGDIGLLTLSKATFASIRQESFSSMVVDQLSKLEVQAEPHDEYYQKGFTLDLLYFLTTSDNTAGIQADEDLFERYYLPKENLLAHLRLLENLKLVLRIVGRGKKMYTRLSHDALAPIIRQRHEQSDKPVQRAHRIFESKKRVTRNELSQNTSSEYKIEYNLIQDKADHEILRQAKDFMYRWSDEQSHAVYKGYEAIKRAEITLKDRTALVFETLANDAVQLIQSLDHLDALPKFEASLNVEVPMQEKQAQLQEGLEELVCFFAHTGQHFQQAQQASRLLLAFEPNETSKTLIEKCGQERWGRTKSFIPLLNRFHRFNTSNFKERYLPTMIDVEGDTFNMGGKVSWQEPSPGQQTNPIHPVKISSFKLAETPFTLYQYALYCAAKGKPITPNTPPWGRQGNHPVVYISWYEAVEIANWLSAYLDKDPYYHLDKTRDSDKHNKTSDAYKYLVSIQRGASGFRLPTEAEWEFAARGGIKRGSKVGKKGLIKSMGNTLELNKTSDYFFAGGDSLDEVGWYWKNSGDVLLEGKYDYEKVMANNGRTQAVKGLKPNELGLYDMSGNVYEWCWDWFDWDYYEECKKKGVVPNPQGPQGSSHGRVLRGGSWNSYDSISRVSIRSYDIPNYRDSVSGFRFSQGL